MNEENKEVRCAIYTRKREGSSCDAQRLAAESFIASQKGWVILQKRYDDSFLVELRITEFQELLKDIELGNIDCVVVHVIASVFRSIQDFAEVIEFFHEHQVNLVVIQTFNTASPESRFQLNMLASFMQYELEAECEREDEQLLFWEIKEKKRFTLDRLS